MSRLIKRAANRRVLSIRTLIILVDNDCLRVHHEGIVMTKYCEQSLGFACGWSMIYVLMVERVTDMTFKTIG